MSKEALGANEGSSETYISEEVAERVIRARIEAVVRAIQKPLIRTQQHDAVYLFGINKKTGDGHIPDEKYPSGLVMLNNKILHVASKVMVRYNVDQDILEKSPTTQSISDTAIQKREYPSRKVGCLTFERWDFEDTRKSDFVMFFAKDSAPLGINFRKLDPLKALQERIESVLTFPEFGK